MKERCSCGARIDLSASGLREDTATALLREWRVEHHHEWAPKDSEPEPQPEGATSHLEQSAEPYSIPGGASIAQPQARQQIGFSA